MQEILNNMAEVRSAEPEENKGSKLVESNGKACASESSVPDDEDDQQGDGPAQDGTSGGS